MKLTDEQKQAIAKGAPIPGLIDFPKLNNEEAALVYRHVTGEEVDERRISVIRERNQVARAIRGRKKHRREKHGTHTG